VAGFAEREGTTLYNSARIIDDQGVLQFVYRKTLLFDADVPWAAVGNTGYRRFETAAGAFGVGICMDLNDDRFVAWCAGADLAAIAFPTAWLEQGIDVWRYWALRLLGVPAALVAANTFGFERGVEFSGRSAILQKNRILAAAGRVGEWGDSRGGGGRRPSLTWRPGPGSGPWLQGFWLQVPGSGVLAQGFWGAASPPVPPAFLQVSFSRTTKTTRRFFAMFSSVSLGATGWDSPKPWGSRRAPSMPFFTR
jgi:hypothetical protein